MIEVNIVLSIFIISTSLHPVSPSLTTSSTHPHQSVEQPAALDNNSSVLSVDS